MNINRDNDDQAMSTAPTEWDISIPDHWKTFVPFMLGDKQCLIAYNSYSGEINIASVTYTSPPSILIDVDWVFQVVIDHKLAPELSIFRSFGNLRYFLAYKLEDGVIQSVTLGQINSVSKDNGLANVTTWQHSWKEQPVYSSLTPLVIGGKPYYLAYDEESNGGTICIIDATGSEPTIVTQVENWGPDWTTFIYLNDRSTILAYNESHGHIKAARVDKSPRIESSSIGYFTPGWRSLIPLLSTADSPNSHFLAFRNTDPIVVPVIAYLEYKDGLIFAGVHSPAIWAHEYLSADAFGLSVDASDNYLISYQQNESVVTMVGDPDGSAKIQSIPRPGYRQ